MTGKESLTVLGQKVTEFTGFETFATPAGVTRVACISDEVSSLCPVTNAPDWYKVSITYWPKDRCVESKTLKLYLQSFRNRGLFCEAFAAKIAEDIAAALGCKCEVSVDQKPRGGIQIVAYARAGCR